MFVKSEVVSYDGDKITVLDADIDEFATICHSLNGVKDMATNDGTDENDIALMIKAGVIPLIKNGTSTRHIFDKYDIDNMYMSVILNEVEELMARMNKTWSDHS